MPDFRGDIRRAIFTKVSDNSVDILQDVIGINRIVQNFSKRYKDFDQLEKLNIELTVPIRLPPNGKKGDCKAIVEEVKKSLNELGGGTTTYHAEGSWLDKQKNVVSDDCVVVFTAIPIEKWYECIPVLQRLIRDEIQSKLFQECVFLRIDNQTFGEPLNLLGDQIEAFPSIEEFGNIDSACMTMMSEYEEHPIQSVMNQKINGDGNTQIAGEDVTAAIGEGAMAAKGDIHVHQGVDPKEHAQILAKNQILDDKLTKLEQETDEDRKEQIGREATKLAEQMLKNKNIEFDAWKLLKLGLAAELAGQIDLAEGFFRQANEKWDNYLSQMKVINKFEDNEFINKIATKILRKLESTEEKQVFKYLESQCTEIGFRIAEQTLQNQDPNIWLPSLHNMIASMFCMGIAIGAGEDLDEILD